MSKSLPLRANIEWLKKTAKQLLEEQRLVSPEATLSDAQLSLAREYGFPSWRQLIAQIEAMQARLAQVPIAPASEGATIASDDPDLAALFAAIDAGQSDQVDALLRQRPALVHARLADGETPLHRAASHNDPALGLLLLVYGADPAAHYGDSGHTALSWAVTCHALEFAQTLVRAGVHPDLFTAAGMGSLPLVQACFDESGKLLPLRVKAGSTRLGPDGKRLPCPPPTVPEQIADALYIACRNGQLAIAQFLATKQPDLSFKAYQGAGLLHWAYFGNSMAIVEMLLEAGLDPAERDPAYHCTPRAFGICVPAQWGFLDLVKRQVQRDATLVLPVDGSSALDFARNAGHDEVVQFLISVVT